MNDYNFGNFLCELREQKNLTQAEIAKLLNVTPAAVSKWENGSSKPRVNVLFQLAQILNVRPEELIAGHYMVTETVNPEIVQEINERYEYLRKVDSYNKAGLKFRRILAWIIDWNLIGSIVIVLISLSGECLLPINSQLGILCMTLAMLLYPLGFIMRDFLFRGRSIGKRIARLVVLNRQTGLPASSGKCILRNLFLPAIYVDGFFLLASGASLGDRAAKTVVISKKMLEQSTNDPIDDIKKINTYSKPRPTNTKKVLWIVFGSIALFFTLLISLMLLLLSTKKDTEEYKVAYTYLVESDTFQELQLDESKIWMNQYSFYSNSAADNDAVSKTAKIGFIVGFKSFQVTCHEINGEWSVCEECTKFE